MGCHIFYERCFSWAEISFFRLLKIEHFLCRLPFSLLLVGLEPIFLQVTLQLRRDPEVTSSGGISLPFSIGGDNIIDTIVIYFLQTEGFFLLDSFFLLDIFFIGQTEGDGGEANVVVSKSGRWGRGERESWNWIQLGFWNPKLLSGAMYGSIRPLSGNIIYAIEACKG